MKRKFTDRSNTLTIKPVTKNGSTIFSISSAQLEAMKWTRSQVALFYRAHQGLFSCFYYKSVPGIDNSISSADFLMMTIGEPLIFLQLKIPVIARPRLNLRFVKITVFFFKCCSLHGMKKKIAKGAVDSRFKSCGDGSLDVFIVLN